MSYDLERLAALGHDLRTPISGIIGMTDLLLMTKTDGEQREYLDAIRGSAEQLLRMANDMMEFSRLADVPAENECVQFSLRKTLHSMLMPFQFMAARKAVRFSYSVEFDVPDRLNGDPARLQRLLTNLIGNAIQFTDQGEIVVYVQRSESSDDRVAVEFTVSDTGIGISREKIGRIFEPYYQVSPSGSGGSTGMGLGLAIAARLAESLQGRIWAESEQGKGSRFHFTGKFGLVAAPACKTMVAAV
jgi:two-component system CheB/CheR fusion protein